MGSNLDPRWANLVDDLFPRRDLQAILDASEAVQATIASPGWPIVMALLEAEVGRLDVELDGDRPLESRADYAAKHGFRGGLRAPERAVQALIGRAESRYAEQRARHERDAEPSPDGSA